MASPEAVESKVSPGLPPAESRTSPINRTPFIVGLALAAVVLIVVLAYIVVRPSGGSDEPTSVKAGSENREYADDPSPTATSSATAAPKPKPRIWRRPPPKPTASSKKPIVPPDIYEDL